MCFFYSPSIKSIILLDHYETQSEKKRKGDDTWELTEEEVHKIKKIPAPLSFCREAYNPNYISNFHPNYVNISVILYFWEIQDLFFEKTRC